MSEQEFWKKCNSCKKPIAYGAIFYVCNVSTCTRKRTGFVFCSVSCWDAHVPMMNHRESWAVEHKAPKKGEPDPEYGPPKPAKAEAPAPQQPAPPSSASGPKVILRRTR